MSEINKDELTGKSLGHFEIMDEIGRGGMASVYRASQQSMGRIVAVKVLPRTLLHDPGFFERFQREVDVIAHLEHPHILPIYDYGQSDGIPYIAMRYLGGGSLEQRLDRGVLSPEELERPLQQVAQALDYAHQQGIIHRDLKPGNIMLDESGNAYLSDFGIARVLGSNLTGSMIVGTPAYMSPEQANGMPVDGRADIYSLGVMLFHLLTGERPFHAETPMAVLLKHINEPMPTLMEFRSDIPETLDDVIQKATAKDPEQRYSSASEMVDAYSVALAEGETKVSRQTRSMMEPRPDEPATPRPDGTQQPLSPAPTQVHPPEPRKRPFVPVLLVLVLVIAIIGAVIGANMVLNSTEDDTGGSVAAIPTPFPRASTITHEHYTVSIPDEWILPQIFEDLSEGDQMTHLWGAPNQSAYISLTLFDAELTGQPVFFRDAVDEYINRHYREVDSTFELIDEAFAEDGTIRRSYWVSDIGLLTETERVGGRLPALLANRLADRTAGQLDIFFMERTPNLVIVEMYTANDTQNTLVRRMQFILDSLRINDA